MTDFVLCSACGRALAEDQARRVPAALRWLAAFALAIGHGGLWAKTELSRPYCARCVVRVAAFAALLACVMLAAAGFGAYLWLTAPPLR